MNIDFNNGATVSRAWRADGSAELLAAFQHVSHAQVYARHQALSDGLGDGVFYIVTDHNTGRVTTFHKAACSAGLSLP